MSKDNEKHAWWRPSLIIFSKISVWIIGPVIVAVVLGKFFDNKFHTQHLFFIVLMVLSFTLSIYKIVKETSKQIKNIEIDIENKKKIKESDH